MAATKRITVDDVDLYPYLFYHHMHLLSADQTMKKIIALIARFEAQGRTPDMVKAF